MSLHLAKVVSTDTDELTLDTGELTITGLHHTVASESGTTDELTHVLIDSTLADALDGRPFFVWLHAAAGHTITVADGTAEHSLYSFCGLELTMTENEGVLLFRNPGEGEGWTAFGSPTGAVVTTSAVQTLTQKTLTDPVVNWQNTTFPSGAISAKNGHALLTAGSAETYTLADPTNGNDDGKELTIYSKTAHAHKVDNSAGSGFDGGGGSLDTLTFGGAIGDCVVLFADAGVWRIKSLRGVTVGGS